MSIRRQGYVWVGGIMGGWERVLWVGEESELARIGEGRCESVKRCASLAHVKIFSSSTRGGERCGAQGVWCPITSPPQPIITFLTLPHIPSPIHYITSPTHTTPHPPHPHITSPTHHITSPPPHLTHPSHYITSLTHHITSPTTSPHSPITSLHLTHPSHHFTHPSHHFTHHIITSLTHHIICDVMPP